MKQQHEEERQAMEIKRKNAMEARRKPTHTESRAMIVDSCDKKNTAAPSPFRQWSPDDINKKVSAAAGAIAKESKWHSLC